MEEGTAITYGHSKDNRPDLKQYIIELLCVEKNIPILGGCEDGNSSDKTLNKNILKSISKKMTECGVQEKDFIYIADSALVTENNLKEMGNNLFITRFPMNYNEPKRLISDAVTEGDWKNIGVLATTKPLKTNHTRFIKE